MDFALTQEQRMVYEYGDRVSQRFDHKYWKAYAENRPLIDVAVELTGLPRAKLQKALDPAKLTRGGIQK